MRYILTFFFAVSAILQSSAQKNSLIVPVEVSKAFTNQYPDVRLKNWQQEKEAYVAAFRQRGRKCRASYSARGAWEATEFPIKWTRNLPDPVRVAWKNCQYAGWLVLDMKKIEMPEQNLYSIHVGEVQSLGPDDANIGSEYDLFFSDNGQLVKKERQVL